MAQSLDDEDDKPLDPAVERVRRRVMRFIAINLGILFLALMAVAIAIVYRIGSRDETQPQAADASRPAETVAPEGAITLAAGARIRSQSLSGNRLSLHVELADGENRLLIYDIAAGKVVSRITVGPGQ